MINKLIILLLFSTVCFADEIKLDNLTIGEKTYTNVVITKKNPDGISIMHESGTARINYKSLPPEIVKLVGGFDRESAEKYKKEESEAQIKFDRQVDKVLKVTPVKPNEQPISKLEILYSREKYLISEINRRMVRLGKLNQNSSEVKAEEIKRQEYLRSELQKVQSEILKLK